MTEKLSLEERLIVAADYKPTDQNGKMWVMKQVLALADKLKGTGVCLKINSALRACGYDLIHEIHLRGLLVFADLKLFDIKETLTIDGALLREAKPDILTTVCTVGLEGLVSLKAELPETEVLGVTVLTNLNDQDTQAMFSCSSKEAVLRFAKIAARAKIDGLISAATEAEMLRTEFGMLLSLNTPAIRPAWSVIANDDQAAKRVMTPLNAIKAGADRIVIGRPITQAENPYDAVMRTLDEMALAVE